MQYLLLVVCMALGMSLNLTPPASAHDNTDMFTQVMGNVCLTPSTQCELTVPKPIHSPCFCGSESGYVSNSSPTPPPSPAQKEQPRFESQPRGGSRRQNQPSSRQK